MFGARASAGMSAGRPQALAYVHVDDAAIGCTFGHCLLAADGGYCAVIVRSTHCITAPTRALLFARFRYWIADRQQYEPVFGSDDQAAYSQAPTFDSAVTALAAMIERFEPNTDPCREGVTAAGLHPELRVLDVYSFMVPRGKGVYPRQIEPLLKLVPSGCAST